MKVCLTALSLVLLAGTATAQLPERVRGIIQAVEGQTLVVDTEPFVSAIERNRRNEDAVVRLTLTDMTGINGLEKRAMADIADNTFVGVTAVKNGDGRWEATEVHIFPESMRGAGEGHYAWDLPESTMTNGAATGVVAKGRRGGTMTVRHAGGNVEIDVTRRTEIVALTMGSRALLVPGAAVMALAAPAQGGGPATAVAVIAETNGVKPPM
jgi:hypothetical protein